MNCWHTSPSKIAFKKGGGYSQQNYLFRRHHLTSHGSAGLAPKMQSWKVKDDEDCIVGLVVFVFSENPKRWHFFFSKRMQQQFNNRVLKKKFSKKKIGAPVLMKQGLTVKRLEQPPSLSKAMVGCRQRTTTSLAFSICSSLIRWSSASRRASRACNLLKECLTRGQNNQYNNANVYYFIQVTQQSQPKSWRKSNKNWNLDF